MLNLPHNVPSEQNQTSKQNIIHDIFDWFELVYLYLM